MLKHISGLESRSIKTQYTSMLQIQFMRRQETMSNGQSRFDQRLKNWHTVKLEWSTLYIDQKGKYVALVTNNGLNEQVIRILCFPS